MRIKGGPELRARLASVVASKPELGRAWAQDAAQRITRDAPRRTGSLARSIKPGEKAGKAAVVGNFYGYILDHGTKAYPITAKKGTLVFPYRGQTIFAKAVHRRRLKRRPFITRNAQEALTGSAIGEQVVKAWSRRGRRFTSL